MGPILTKKVSSGLPFWNNEMAEMCHWPIRRSEGITTEEKVHFVRAVLNANQGNSWNSIDCDYEWHGVPIHTTSLCSYSTWGNNCPTGWNDSHNIMLVSRMKGGKMRGREWATSKVLCCLAKLPTHSMAINHSILPFFSRSPSPPFWHKSQRSFCSCSCTILVKVSRAYNQTDPLPTNSSIIMSLWWI